MMSARLVAAFLTLAAQPAIIGQVHIRKATFPLPDATQTHPVDALLEAIQDKRIVFIGERYHTDSVAGKFHRDLVERLIAEHGFSFILSEVPFYVSSTFWEETFWQETLPFHASAMSNTGHWLRDVSKQTGVIHQGMDCGIRSTADKEVQYLLNGCDEDTSFFASSAWLGWRNAFGQLSQRRLDHKVFHEFKEHTRLLNKAIDTYYMPNECDLTFLRMYLVSMAAELENDLNYYHKLLRQKRVTFSLHNYRDSVMANVAEHFIRTAPPETKFVILMSNYHVMRNADLIKSGIRENKKKIRTTADRLSEAFGDDLYSIATINYKDELQRRLDEPGKKSDRSNKSIEYELLNSCPADPCFIDISKETRSWVMSPTFRKKNLVAPWGELYDGLLYFKEL